MSDAPVQLDLSDRLKVAGLAEDLPAGAALRRRRGGTGVSVETLAELQAELGIGSTAPMTGSTSSTDGAGGSVPQPLAGTQAKALVGAGIFSSDLELAHILSSSGVQLVLFSILGDGDNGLYLAAAATGNRRARIGTRSTNDDDVDLVLEPKGSGVVSVWGDPLEKLIRPSCGIFAQADAAAFSTRGLAAPVVESFDTAGAAAAPAILRDAGGHYVETSTDDLAGAISGFMSAAGCLQRQTEPAIYFVGRSAFLQSRVWLAATLTDPADATDLATAGNAGVGLWVDYAIHAPGRTLRLITCSGVALSLSKSAGVCSIDSSGRLDRNDGGSWITDGVRLGDLVTLGGFATGGNNGTHRVSSFATSGRRIVFVDVLTTESSPAVPVTLTHPGQEEIDTGVTLTANARFAVRLRYLAASFAWEFSTFNFTTKIWENYTATTGVAPTEPTALLRLFWRNRALDATVRKTACQGMFFRRGA